MHSGFYLGINGGVGVFDAKVTEAGTGADMFRALGDSINTSQVDAVFGGQVGYNHQIEQIVFGVEGDMNWTGFNKKRTENPRRPPPPGPFHAETQWHWVSTVRGRIGWAHDNVLFYGTGGLAIVRARNCGSELKVGDPPPCTNDGDESFGVTNTEVGFAVGAGAEMKLRENWSLKAEYLYIDIGTGRQVYDSVGAGAGQAAKFKSSAHIFRMGVNYNFGCPVC